VHGVFAVKRAILFKFQFFLHIPPVLAGGIVPPLALTALERDKFHNLFFARHSSTSRFHTMEFYEAKPQISRVQYL
jgi:hypothetical protein